MQKSLQQQILSKKASIPNRSELFWQTKGSPFHGKRQRFYRSRVYKQHEKVI